MARITSVFLDRDGTVIVDKHYLADPAGVELLPHAAEGMAALAAAGMRLFVVTNQSGIGRGYFTEAAYHACHAALERCLHEAGVSIEGTAFCPHGPEDECECRKPRVGMWRALAEEFGLIPANAAMVGDKMDDILFGRAAGFPLTVLVLTGKGEKTAREKGLPLPSQGEPYRAVAAAVTPEGAHLPHAVAADLAGAAQFILDQQVL